MNLRSSRFGDFGLIVANSHPTLGLEIATKLGVTPLRIESGPFPNGELNLRRIDDASGLDICVFSSLYADKEHDPLGEMEAIVESVYGSASRVFGVFPFVMNGKSDKKKRFGETVAYLRTARRISNSGLDVVAIFDQHSAQHPYYYDTSHNSRLRTVHHIYLMRILIEYAQANKGMFDSVLALDMGGFGRNTMIAETLGLPVSFIIKHRDPATREINLEKSRIVGDVSGQRVIAFDDMVQGGGTVEMGAKIAKYKGAKSVWFFVVHNDFTPQTFGRLNPLLQDGTIDKIFILETIPLRDKEKWHENLVVLSPAELIAKVIERIHLEGHMRDLFLAI